MVNQDRSTVLAKLLQEFWETYSGVRPAYVRVVSDETSVAVWLGDVLSPAEQRLADSEAGREALRKFRERILEQARPQLRQLITDTVSFPNMQIEIYLDVATGSMIGFFWSGGHYTWSG